MKDFLKLIIITIFLFACATTNTLKENSPFNKNFLNTLLNSLPSPESPEVFEKHFPDSKLILNYITVFYKDYPTALLTDNITDFALNDNQLILLKNNKIDLINNKCHSFILPDDVFEKIEYSDNIVAVFSKKRVILFNLTNCSQFFELPLKWKFFKFSDKYYFITNGKDFKIFKYTMLVPLIKGTFTNKYIDAQFQDDLLKVLDSKGQIMKFNLIKLSLDNITKTGINVKYGKILKNSQIVSDENNRVIFDNKTLFKISEKPVLSKNTLDFFANNFIYIPNKNIKIHEKHIGSFGRLKDFLFYKQKKSLFYKKLSKIYMKKIIFKAPNLSCEIYKKRAVITDLDNSKIYLKDNSTSCKFLNGKFINNENRTIYNFAEKISSKGNYTMYKRKKGETIYYFFIKR
jgi:hypothetical protein